MRAPSQDLSVWTSDPTIKSVMLPNHHHIGICVVNSSSGKSETLDAVPRAKLASYSASWLMSCKCSASHASMSLCQLTSTGPWRRHWEIIKETWTLLFYHIGHQIRIIYLVLQDYCNELTTGNFHYNEHKTSNCRQHSGQMTLTNLV